MNDKQPQSIEIPDSPEAQAEQANVLLTQLIKRKFPDPPADSASSDIIS